MMDQAATRAVEAYVHADYPLDAKAILLIESDGTPEEVAAEMAEIKRVLAASGATEIRVSKDERERLLFWSGRKAAFPAVGRITADYLCMDGTIPRRALPHVLLRIDELAREFGLRCANVFHAGDGNLHPLIMYDANVADEASRAERFGAAILELCIDVGGTVTGEHGVGVEKLRGMCSQFRPAELERFLGREGGVRPARTAQPRQGACPRSTAAPNSGRCTCTTASSRIPTCRASERRPAMNALTDLKLARPSAAAVAGVVDRLMADYGDRATTGAAIRAQHSRGEGMPDAALPDVVVWPRDNDEVVAIVRLAAAARVPVIPFGVGTSLEGHVAALGRRRVHRPVADGPRAGGQRRRPRLSRAGGRHPRAAQRRAQGHRPLLPDRPRRQRDAGRAWRRRARRAPTRSATARCARTCSGSPSSPPTAG